MVDIGEKNVPRSSFDSNEPTFLGRDYLLLFSSTEFDWENHKIRLGRHWLHTEA